MWTSSCVKVMLLVWSVVLMLQLIGVDGADGDAYGLVSATQTECEIEALTLGTRLGDAFNSYEESVDLMGRTRHHFFHQSPFFVRMLHGEWERRGVSPSTHGHKHEGHQHWNISAHSAAFGTLYDKHIYLVGDRSMFPLIQTILSPLVDSSVQDMEQWKQAHCVHRKTQSKYVSTPSLPDKNSYVCDSAAYGPQGRLTFEWNDFLLENFQSQTALGSEIKLFSDNDKERISPDVFLVQVGHYGCMLSYNRENGAVPDGQIEDRTVNNVEKWINALASLISSTQSSRSKPLSPIISLASRNHFQDFYSDFCTGKVNRKLAFAAHQHHWIVLEREELENRIFYRSEQSHQPVIPPRDVSHFPVPQIVTASLVSMLSCLEKNITFQLV